MLSAVSKQGFQYPKFIATTPAFGPRFRAISSMLRSGFPDTLDALWSLWPGAEAAVETAASVSHCRTLARHPPAVLRATAVNLSDIERRISVFQPAQPSHFGF